MAATTITPTTLFTITDPKITAENVTGFEVKFGKVSGQYTLVGIVPVKDIQASAGQATGLFSDITPQPGVGTWFAAAFAVNSAGESLTGTAEIQLIVPQPLPSPPVSFLLA